MRSDYHNCATFNGVVQNAGRDVRSKDTVYDPESGKMTLNLTDAYPKEADLRSYTRSAVLLDSKITVTDDVSLNSEGSVCFSFITRVMPESVTDSSFVIEDRCVRFDDTLAYSIEELDKTYPEVANIPAGWDAEALFRITLSSKSPVKDKKYVLTVE